MACIEGVVFLIFLAVGSLAYAFSKQCPSTELDEHEIEYVSLEQTLSEKNRLAFSLHDEEEKVSSMQGYNVNIMKLYYEKYPSALMHQLRDFSRKSDQVYLYKNSLVFIFPFFDGNEAIKNKIEERYSQFIKVRYEDMELKNVEWFAYNENRPLERDEFMS